MGVTFRGDLTFILTPAGFFWFAPARLTLIIVPPP